MKRGVKFLSVLGLALVLFAGAAWAQCPPGSVAIDAATLPPAGWIAAGVVNVPPNTTVCVRGDIVLGAGAWAGITQFNLAANARVVGGSPGVTITGSGTAVVIFTLAGNGATLEGFRILQGAGALETHAVQIAAVANDCVVRDMTITDVAAGSWATAAVEILGGMNHTIQGNAFWVYGATAPVAVVSILGGNDHLIVDNTVNIMAGAAPATVSINSAAGNAIEILRNQINNNVATTVDQIVVNTVNTKIADNVITFNAAVGLAAGGIWVNAAMNEITGNVIRNPGGITAGGGSLSGIWVGAGAFNAQVIGNTITGCGYDTPLTPGVDIGNAIHVLAANVVVRDNTLQTMMATGGAFGTTWMDQAAGVYIAPGATGAVVEGNTINSATSGIVVGAPAAQVKNNTITDAATGADAALTAAWAVPACGIAIYASGAEIEGNTIMNVSNVGTDNNSGYVGGHGVGLFGVLPLGYAPAFPGSLGAEVLNNTIRSAARHGISVQAATSVGNTFQNNTIEDCNNNGVDVNVGAFDQEILNNIIRRCGNSGIFVNNGALNAEIIGNTLEDNGAQGSPPVAPTVSEALVVSGGADNAEVRGNTIRTTVTLPENRGIRVEGVRNVLVTENLIENTSPTTLTHGIVIEIGTRSCVFSQNTIKHMQEVGILIRGGSAILGEVEVTANELINNAVGILFDGGASEVTCNLIWGGSDGIRVSAGIPVVNHVFENNAIYSPIRARNLGVSTFNAQGNYWGDPAGPPAKTVFGPVDTSNWLTAHPTCAPTPPEGVVPGLSHTYGAVAGWYMVSLPAPGAAADFGVTLYRWDPATQNYLIATTVEPGKGYWANLPASATVTATGTVPTSDIVVDISAAGWHQISAPWIYPKAEIRVIKGAEEKTWADAVAAGWVRDTIYAYTAVDGNYTTPTTLNPWYGYWVEAKVAGLSLKFLVAEGTPVTSGMLAPMGLPALATPAGLPPFPVEGMALGASLDVGAYPNPVTDVHTTTFRVVGPMAGLVEEIVVKIFDLSGRLVWEGSAAGAELEWHTESLTGEYLANGVYLYQVQVRVLGEWLATGLNKVAIYR